MRRADGTGSASGLRLLAITTAIVLLSLVAFRIEDSPHLRWTGPYVPRAIFMSMSMNRARAMVSPYIEYFLVIERDGVIDFVFDTDPDFDRLVMGIESAGIPAPIGRIGLHRRELGIWGPSFRTTGWWITYPEGFVPDGAQRLAVIHASQTTQDPERRTIVTPWIIVDLVGLLLVFAWCRLLFGGIRHGWRFRLRRRNIGSCLACGYDLTGLPAPVCPECGGRMNSVSQG
jgi:hypothetical protein